MAPNQRSSPRMAWGSQQQQGMPPIASVASGGSALSTKPFETNQTLTPLTARCPASSPYAWGAHAAMPLGLKMEFPLSARAGTPLGLRSATPDVPRATSPDSIPIQAASKCSALGPLCGKPKASRYRLEKLSGSPKPSTTSRSSRSPKSSRREHKIKSILTDGSGAHEDLQKVSTLLQYLQVAGVKFLRGSYLCHLRDRGELLPRHQDIPPSAFCSLEEVGVFARACGFEGKPLVVSHPWWSFQHPDPSGIQLHQICMYLETKLSPTWSAMPNRPVFIDYCSIPFPVVRDRSPDGSLDFISPLGLQEDARVKRALRNIHILYAHDHTTVLRLDGKIPPEAPLCAPYYSRGWCAFEWRISMTKKDAACSMSFTDRRTPQSRRGCALLTPTEFKAELERLRFTVKDDRERISGLYAKVFATRTALTKVLCLQGLTANEMLYVARALSSYSRLEALRLLDCGMDEDVEDALTEALDKGAAPCLRIVKPCGNTEPPLKYPALFSALERRKINIDMGQSAEN